MHFFDKKSKSVKLLAYLLMLVIFSGILYFVLSFFEKIPSSWNYLHVLGIAIGIIFISRILKRILS
ncbi:hypothetical protein J4423_02015 [Candidatus Pacearchaeota archaeon]|nr:hypothetical protein [Candidatus Pacearchaeota archaeon]